MSMHRVPSDEPEERAVVRERRHLFIRVAGPVHAGPQSLPGSLRAPWECFRQPAGDSVDVVWGTAERMVRNSDP